VSDYGALVGFFILTFTLSCTFSVCRGRLVQLGGNAKGAWLWVIFGWRILFGSGM